MCAEDNIRTPRRSGLSTQPVTIPGSPEESQSHIALARRFGSRPPSAGEKVRIRVMGLVPDLLHRELPVQQLLVDNPQLVAHAHGEKTVNLASMACFCGTE